MSVLIKDISFPRKPDQITVIFRFNDPIGDCTHTHYIAPNEIVEVPTPHGRLIDADELPHYTGYALSANEVAKAVEAAPTIIEAEEREEA